MCQQIRMGNHPHRRQTGYHASDPALCNKLSNALCDTAVENNRAAMSLRAKDDLDG